MNRIATPICMSCGVVMKCKKNGFLVKDPQAGNFPSTYWRGDLYKCPTCGVEIVSGTGDGMTAEQCGSEADEAKLFSYDVGPKPANQCDGCIRGLPLRGGIHYTGDRPYMGCTRDRYQPTNEEVIADFKSWSGGFPPSECDDSQLGQYLELACPWPELKAHQLIESERGA